MPADLQFRTVPSSYSRSSMGTIAGVIYLQAGTTAFPEAGWDDAVVLFTLDLLYGLTGLQARPKRETAVEFRDGPFLLRLVREGDLVRMFCVNEARRGTVIEHELVAEWSLLVQRALELAGEVRRGCEDRGWESTELAMIRSLEAAANRLQPMPLATSAA